MSNLKDKLIESGCSTEFIADALRYERLYEGDIDDFIDRVEDILMLDEEYEYEENFEDESDPIYESDYNYDGNDEDTYFEEEDDEEFYEDDEDY